MKEEKTRIDELIIEYLTKRIDTNSLADLKKWVKASPDNERYFSEQQEIWFSAISNDESSIYDKDKAFEQFKAKIENTTRRKIGRRILNLHLPWRIASVALVLFAIIYTSYQRGAEDVKSNFADIVIQAPLGSQTQLSLPDGSLVWLNAGSRITYSQGFGVDSRKIKLVGEGYFEVKKNKENPFLVQTENLLVKVLGTKFNFRDYPEDTEVIVSLLEGKIALNNLICSEAELTLLPNEKAILNKETGKIQLEKTQGANTIEWPNGNLFFDEELLEDIAKKLERIYDVKIRIDNDSLKKYRFYGNFVNREQNIHEVLNALSSTKKIRYSVQGRNITIY